MKTEYILNQHSSRAANEHIVIEHAVRKNENGQLFLDKDSARSSAGCQANEQDFDNSKDLNGYIKKKGDNSTLNEEGLKEQFKIL